LSQVSGKITETFLSHTAEDTYRTGAEFARKLKQGDVVLLDGSLGAGKTVFAKGVASGFGIDPDDVTSPSFTLVNNHVGRLPLFHVDLYRLEPGIGAAAAAGLDELLENEESLILIEWGDRLEGYAFPTPAWRVLIEGDGDEPRRIRIER
jgi:tRNA threonylcarbamoyladenosine biosynthesis protein TsaE